MKTKELLKNRWTAILLLFTVYCVLFINPAGAQNYDNPDTIVVARDGTGQFRTITDAIEVCRAFMDYHKVIYIKKGTYKEKLIIPQWLQNIELCGEDRNETIITYDDHANILMDARFWPAETSRQLIAMGERQKLGTFRSFTVRVDANDITFKNLTIENNAAKLGQAVALHTQGDRLTFVNCRFLGNQDTVYTGMPATRLYFSDCYIEGTTDFIFGPSTAWFENCQIYCKINSYITAASTPQESDYGYIFNNCTITCAPDVTKVYLGRPWRDYGYTLFMHCSLPKEIRPEGWHHWQKEREQTARYLEFENNGPGAATDKRVPWSRQLTKKEAQAITLDNVFQRNDKWIKKFVCGASVLNSCKKANTQEDNGEDQLSNPAAKVVSTELIRTSQSWDGVELPDYFKGRPELVAVKYVFPAGQKLGWHHHVAMNYGVLVQGELTIIGLDGKTKVVHEGEAVVEMVGTVHHGENRGTKDCILYMFYLSQKDLPLAVQHPDIPLN